jgi:hypothetical protein
LAILSVTYSEKVDGYIFIEAYKEINVKEAIKGINNVLGGKIVMMPKKEMHLIYMNDSIKMNEMKPY